MMLVVIDIELVQVQVVQNDMIEVKTISESMVFAIFPKICILAHQAPFQTSYLLQFSRYLSNFWNANTLEVSLCADQCFFMKLSKWYIHGHEYIIRYGKMTKQQNVNNFFQNALFNISPVSGLLINWQNF